MKKGALFLSCMALATSGLLLSASANASYVNVDYLTEGDNLVVQDTDTGLEYLSLIQTVNMSVEDVIAQTGNGGQFEGWSVMSFSQAQVLANGFFGDIAPVDTSIRNTFVNNGVPLTSELQDRLADFSDFFGTTYSQENRRYTYGLFESDGSSGSNYLLLGVDNDPSPSGANYYWMNHYDQAYGNIYDGQTPLGVYGTWLVRQSVESNNINASEVPVLFSAIGMLLGVLAFRRRS